MTEVKWVKIVTDIFDDEKIMLIESMPEGDAIIVIWFKMLCLAGKQNNGGVFQINERFPYTDDMFATIFRRNVNVVRLALATFEKFGMIEIVENTVTIPKWEKHQQVDALEASRAASRKRVARYREKQRQLIAGNAKPLPEPVDNPVDNSETVMSEGCNVTVADDVTPCYADRIRIRNRDRIRDTNNSINTIVSSEQSGDCAEQTEKVVFKIPLNDGSEYPVTQAEIDANRELYPGVNVEQEYRNMIGWCNGNPKKRKTKSGVKRFVHAWLAREQNRGENTAWGPSGGPSNAPERYGGGIIV